MPAPALLRQALRRVLSFDAAVTAPLTLAESRRAARAIALVVAHTGDSPVWATLLVGAWLIGGPPWRARVIVAVIGLLAAEIATVIIKVSVRRQRPPGTSGAIYRKTDPFSFPSGHAARAAMLSILSWVMVPGPLFFAILAWSPIMILSRVAIGIHYVLDIIAGILLGMGLTFALIAAMNLVLSRL
jgi:membrane-associated phospholipid phosphatase